MANNIFMLETGFSRKVHYKILYSFIESIRFKKVACLDLRSNRRTQEYNLIKQIFQTCKQSTQ